MREEIRTDHGTGFKKALCWTSFVKAEVLNITSKQQGS